jgi:hypothetical protein
MYSACFGCVVQRREFVIILCVNLGAFLQQEIDTFNAALTGCEKEQAVEFLALLGKMREQKSEASCVSSLCR